MRRPITLLMLSLLALCAGFAHAQDNPGQYAIPIPERWERPVVTDEDGLQQWADLEEYSKKQENRDRLRCPTCKGTGKQACPFCWRMEHHEECPECHTGHDADDDDKVTKCRTCAGEGTIPDILLKAPCPGCAGAGITRCHVCGGEGSYTTSAANGRRSKCPVCRGPGSFPCGVCKGEKLVEPPKMKPSVGEAELDDLKAAQEELVQIAAKVAAIASEGDARKDSKKWGDALKKGAKLFPPMRPLLKDLEDNTKDLGKGSIFTQYKEMVTNHTNERKAAVEYYIKHQQRLLELCIARAEHNAKARGDDGGK